MNAHIPNYLQANEVEEDILEEIQEWFDYYRSPTPPLNENRNNFHQPRPDIVPTPPSSRNSHVPEEDPQAFHHHQQVDMNFHVPEINFLEVELNNLNDLFQLYQQQVHNFNPRLNMFNHLVTMPTQSWPVGQILLSITYNDAVHIILRERNYFHRFFSEVIFNRDQVNTMSNHLLNAIIHQIRAFRHSNYFLFITSRQTTIFYNASEIVNFIRDPEE